MLNKTKITKTSDAKVFYLVLICAVAAVQIALKVFTTLVPDTQSQRISRIMEAGMLLCALFLALRTTFVQPWLGLRVQKGPNLTNFIVIFIRDMV